MKFFKLPKKKLGGGLKLKKVDPDDTAFDYEKPIEPKLDVHEHAKKLAKETFEDIIKDNPEPEPTPELKPNLCENEKCLEFGMWHPNENCKEEPEAIIVEPKIDPISENPEDVADTIEDKPQSQEELIQLYNKLQDQCNQNPTPELKSQLANLLLMIYPPNHVEPIVQAEAEASVILDHDETLQTVTEPPVVDELDEQLTPEQIANEYHLPDTDDIHVMGANPEPTIPRFNEKSVKFNEPETKIIESTKHNPECVECGSYIRYDANDEQYCPNCSALEQKDKIANEEFIKEQKSKQGSVQKERAVWRSQKEELEEFALEEFCDLEKLTGTKYMEDEQGVFAVEQKGELKFVEKAEELTNDLNEKLKQVTREPIDDSFTDMDGDDSLNQDLQITPDPSVSTPVIEDDLTMPTTLDPAVQKVWHLFPKDVQLQMIAKEHLEAKEKIQINKEKILGKKTNFFKKKKELKPRLNPDRPQSFFEKLFKIKKEQTLKDVEAYCYKCKHGILAHQHKGRSTGCKECGCLVPIQKILEINKVKFNTEKEKELTDNGHVCTCGHREIIHQDQGFCEEKGCYCYEYKITS